MYSDIKQKLIEREVVIRNEHHAYMMLNPTIPRILRKQGRLNGTGDYKLLLRVLKDRQHELDAWTMPWWRRFIDNVVITRSKPSEVRILSEKSALTPLIEHIEEWVRLAECYQQDKEVLIPAHW